jgi:PAS domain-containing protein
VLQTVIDHLPCGVTLVDAQLNMLAYAGEFLRLLEFPPGPVEVGEPTFETFIRYNAERGKYGPGDIDDLVRRIVERAPHGAAYGPSPSRDVHKAICTLKAFRDMGVRLAIDNDVMRPLIDGYEAARCIPVEDGKDSCHANWREDALGSTRN